MTDPILEAAATLRRGGIVAYPTETVYGLGCRPDDEVALRRLIDIKGRDADKGFILLAGHPMQLVPYVTDLDDTQWHTITRPGERATSWTVPPAAGLSPLLTGCHDRIAIRVTTHPPVVALCQQAGSALVSTSANPSGQPPVKSAAALDPRLAARLDYVLDAPCGDDPRPSRIIDLESGRILRP